MGKRPAKSEPRWGDVKSRLAGFDRAALLGVLQDLYAADEGNRAFLHARFGLGDEPLQPYKKTINRWLWPDVFRGQQASVSRAKGAITRYTKALGDPVGLAELMVFYCEWAAAAENSSAEYDFSRGFHDGGSELHWSQTSSVEWF